MSASRAAAPAAHGMAVKRYWLPRIVIARFVARRTLIGAAFWALVFGLVVASKASAYVHAYPTAQDRAGVVASFANNVGINAFLGVPRHIDTVAGYVAWNTLLSMVIISSIWALLLATKYFRGEEDNGRMEMLLSGPTTPRRAAANTLAGLGVSILILYAIVAATFVGVGKIRGVDFGTQSALFFALCAVMGAAVFMAMGAFFSQVMPTRARAAGVTAAVFGGVFALRAAADTTSASWLLNLSPLGWIEKMQPLYNSRPMWLLPLFGLTLLLVGATIFIAGWRDLGDSFFAGGDTAKPHTALLNTPLALAVRLTRGKTISWLVGLALGGAFLGILSRSVTQVVANASSGAVRVISSFVGTNAATLKQAAAKAFLGFTFFMVMILTMSYAASAVGSMREEEASGYLDNLLVRKVGRLQWLWGRLALTAFIVVAMGMLASSGAWIAAQTQHVSVPFGAMLAAGLNMAAAPLFVVGMGVFAMGFMPRLTTVVAYSAAAWSFLIEIIGSGINLNHWILDTSITHHIALAPAVAPNWQTNTIIVILGLLLCMTGALRFRRRDLATE